MSSAQLRIAFGLPRPDKPIFRAMQDAGVSTARPLRNAPWISPADDGTVVFKLIARHIERHDQQLIARIDPRQWGDYGLNVRKAEEVVETLARQVGTYIRVVIVEREGTPTRGRYDDQPWLVTERQGDFILRRRPVEPGDPGTPEEFTRRMLRIYTDGRDQIGYAAHRFRGKVQRDGGVSAAKFWLRPGSSATEGFVRLLDHGRPDLSMEAVVLEPRWSHLFTKSELAVAEDRLRAISYPPASAGRVKHPLSIYPDEVDVDGTFDEGVRRTITVNAYERDPQARAACIRRYGTQCYVCSFDFEKMYGSLGEGFIHVHHLLPLAQGGRVTTDPVVDLRPVCPNCHAMLHRMEPPLPVAQLRKLMKRAARERVVRRR
jgi:5-methylcytosine-specific restriction protein A